MFQKILTVCTGNICRSPLAEALLRRSLASHRSAGASEVQVQSAGMDALVGEPVDDTVLLVAQDDAEIAATLALHRARQATVEMLRWADLILAMEPHHVRHILELAPTARGKTFLLGHWQGDAPIYDPYRKAEPLYRAAQAHISGAVQAWVERLR